MTTNHISLPGLDGPLFIDDGGQGGIPVVFLHSAGGSTRHWDAQLAHLRRTRRAIAIDLRGHGRSGAATDGAYGPDAMAADALGVLDALAIPRAIVAGHSMGGAVAVAMAGRAPDRVAGLLLLDPAGDGRIIPRGQAAALLAGLRTDAYASIIEEFWAPMLEASAPAVRASVLDGLRTTRRDAMIASLDELLTFDPATPLLAYPGPKLSVITHFNDQPGAYHNLVPNLPARRLDGTGHWLQLDKPAEVNALVEEFLASVA